MLPFTVTEFLLSVLCNLGPLAVTVHAALFHPCLNRENLLEKIILHTTMLSEVCFHKERFAPPLDSA